MRADVKDARIEHKCKCGTVVKIEVKPDGQTFEKRLNLVRK